jgi:hypothetical protein
MSMDEHRICQAGADMRYAAYVVLLALVERTSAAQAPVNAVLPVQQVT